MTSMLRQSCDRKLIRLYRARLAAAGTAAVILCAAGVLAAQGPLFALFFYPGICAAAAVAAAVLLPRRMYARLCYIRHADWLMIERGLVIRRCILIPRAGICLAAERAGFLENKLGLCTLELSTGAGHVRLPGLTRADASRLRELLGRRTYYKKAG